MSVPFDLLRRSPLDEFNHDLPRLRERLRKMQASRWLIMQDFEGLRDTRIIFAEHRAQGYLQHQQAGVARHIDGFALPSGIFPFVQQCNIGGLIIS
jgi:hypothetical protein